MTAKPEIAAPAEVKWEDVEFWMVWTKTGHVSRYCHNTEASAIAEAERLARLVPTGRKFIVMRAYRKAHVEPMMVGTAASDKLAAQVQEHRVSVEGPVDG